MSFEFPPRLEARYLKKKKCDKIQEYIKNSGNLFTFQGNITPHGHYDVQIFYDSEKKISLTNLKKHYKTLLDILIGGKQEF